METSGKSWIRGRSDGYDVSKKTTRGQLKRFAIFAMEIDFAGLSPMCRKRLFLVKSGEIMPHPSSMIFAKENFIMVEPFLLPLSSHVISLTSRVPQKISVESK